MWHRVRGTAALTVAGGLAVAGAVVSTPAAAVAHTRVAAHWRDATPMPQARGEVGVAAVDGRVFVVGGTVRDGAAEPAWASTLVTSYDPRTGRWSTHAPLPRPLTHVGVAGLGGRLYAFGGFTGIVHLRPQPVAYEYDVRRDSWRRLPDLPTALGSVSVAALDGRLHLLGGRDSHRVEAVPGLPIEAGFGTVRTHLVYDPARRAYAAAPPLPVVPRDHAGVAVLDGRIHVLGGRDEDVARNLARHDVYDPRTRRWSEAAPLPVPRSAGAAVVLDGRIVYAGGECRPGSDTETFDDVTVYHPRTDRWSSLPPLPHGGRHGFGAAASGGRAYFVAGAPACGGGATADNLQLGPLTRRP
ncbi:hypothetical protein Val02_05860 [Virgisporangium aliadipatigenens]|uniref:Galactose oxidase n=1 Tax=Virgisporangium aliadipatigenens TaxID=741659 RepID=A0A8J3YGM9_9ACTN|nr:kelch repeat-containing protein [Virgisporangium aliadipatigenens]GIJ43700.1 hypothetical protein Val02_05860 [Virgisporangium aliadipatigenens]